MTHSSAAQLPLPDCRAGDRCLTGRPSGRSRKTFPCTIAFRSFRISSALTHVENRGAAFGIFADSPSEWKIATLVLFSIVALVVVSALLWQEQPSHARTGIGLGADSGRRNRQSLGPPAAAATWSIFCSFTSANISGRRSTWPTARSWSARACWCSKSSSARRQRMKKRSSVLSKA